MRPSYVIFGLMEIAAGFAIFRRQDVILAWLRQSWRPFPVNDERDAFIVALLGPFVAALGVVTALVGML